MLLNAIDLFAGAGGLSLGLHLAGWYVTDAFEFDTQAVHTYQNNFDGTNVIKADVREIDFSSYRGIDLVVGGPPCQPFSVAGKQLASADSRDMVPHFVRAIQQSQPKAFMMENVAGLLTRKHHHYVANTIAEFESAGYDVDVCLLDAACFGVPQHRKRVFFVGTQHGQLSFDFPHSTHGDDLSPLVTVEDALKSVPDDEPNNAIVTYAKRPVLRPSPWAGMLVNGKGRPLNLTEPSRTIPATAGGNRTHILDPDGVLLKYHQYLMQGGKPRSGIVDGVRRITVRESARLQSFPDSFCFLGTRSSQYKQVGNAVPPLLAYALGKSLQTSFSQGSVGSSKILSRNEKFSIQLPLFHVV